MHDPRAAAAPVVGALAEALDGRVTGVYVGGSLAAGDYHPAVSDLDVVVLLDSSLTRRSRAELVALHSRLTAEHAGARSLHCVYIPRGEVLHPERRHWTWAFGDLFRRPLSGIARAELLADPIVAFGPAPSTWLPPMDAAAIEAAARAELTGYWAAALRRRGLWLDDVYVDLGLTVWARADAVIREGRLITKREAIERLRLQDLPVAIVEGVAARRAGEPTELTPRERAERADAVRGFLVRELKRFDHA